MESFAEIKNDVEELEPQVERLKSLYQQYFMGIEKLPPLVLRKKVDRTIWKLRRIRFPNTALRFKFQQIIQRYNTYQQYWARVMREIERGTFKGHVARAAKRFGADAVTDHRARRALAGNSEPPAEEKQEQRIWELPEGIDDLDFDDAPTPPSNRFEVPAELAGATYAAGPVRGMPAELLHAMVGDAAQDDPPEIPPERPSQKRGALFGAVAKPDTSPAPTPDRSPAPTLGKPPPPSSASRRARGSASRRARGSASRPLPSSASRRPPSRPRRPLSPPTEPARSTMHTWKRARPPVKPHAASPTTRSKRASARKPSGSARSTRVARWTTKW